VNLIHKLIIIQEFLEGKSCLCWQKLRQLGQFLWPEAFFPSLGKTLPTIRG